MKIAFLPSTSIPFHARTLDLRPLGGTETATIRLAEALHRLGNQVFVFSGMPNPPLSSPLYLPYKAIQDVGSVDALIAVREWQLSFMPLKSKHRFFWTGDSFDQVVGVGLGDKRIVKHLDAFLAVSDWQRLAICKASGFPADKTHILRNGIQAQLFASPQPRIRKRLIYSSTPYRGLRHLVPIFNALKSKHPELELHIFSGFDVYAAQGVTQPESVIREFAELQSIFSQIPGCVLHGNVKQDQLAQEFLKSSILAYPNTFEETSCITALEAQAAGCPIVTSALGALPETVGNAGILVQGTPGSENYNLDFIAATDRLLSDDQLWNQLSVAGLEQAKQFDWNIIGLGFQKYLENRITGQVRH